MFGDRTHVIGATSDKSQVAAKSVEQTHGLETIHNGTTSPNLTKISENVLLKICPLRSKFLKSVQSDIFKDKLTDGIILYSLLWYVCMYICVCVLS